MLFEELFDVRGQVRRKKTETASCLFITLVAKSVLLRLLVRCLLRILMVRLHGFMTDACVMGVVCVFAHSFCFLCCVEGLLLRVV